MYARYRDLASPITILYLQVPWGSTLEHSSISDHWEIPKLECFSVIQQEHSLHIHEESEPFWLQAYGGFHQTIFLYFQLKSAGQMPYTPGQWLPRENFYVRQDWPNFDSKFVSMLTFLRLTRRTSRLSNWLGIQSNLFLLETFELEFTRALLAYTAISNVQRL